MRILKKSLISAFVCESISILLVVTGTNRDYDVIGFTFLGRIGQFLHRPGMGIENHASGGIISWIAIFGIPFLLWFLAWLVIRLIVEFFKPKATPNNASKRTASTRSA